jgi:3-methyladenine DNA glycosylase/8-oxoguanine DNA glycosylase
MTIKITAPSPYNFASTVRDHGWIALLPFRWLENETMQRVERLSNGKIALLNISTAGKNVIVAAEPDNLAPSEETEIIQKVRWILRLDEDFSEFYEVAKREPALSTTVGSGRGRLLRSTSIFEDVIKTICTTNTTWSQTKAMVGRLVNTLGTPYSVNPELRAFPTPDQIASASEALFQSEIRLGYRGAYVQQLAREVLTGERDLEVLTSATLTTLELKRELKKIKGVGDYAAHTLLMILGHYDEVAVDTELRAHVRRVYPNGHALTDKEMAALYEQWGKWKYLVYWYGMIAGPVS